MARQRSGSAEAGQVSDTGVRKLSVPKASDVLADELRRQIVTGELPEGSLLPVERELTSMTGLSRGSVRDALRELEVEGLVHIRPGRAGGSYVRRPDISTLERSLNVLVGGQGVRFTALVEAREALEPAAAALAAEHRTEDDLERLDEASRRLDEAQEMVYLFRERNIDWHIALVNAAHNEILHACVGALWRVIGRGTVVADFHSARTLQDTLKAHRRITDAVRGGDREQAASEMTAHAHAYREEVYRLNLAHELLL
jgi:DNA-binding FadR family transcriptional regulator